MTIHLIAQIGTIRIYEIELPRASVGAGASSQVTENFAEGGRFLGCSTALDSDAGTATSMDIFCVLRNVDNSQLVYGQALDTVELRVQNSAGVAVNIGAHALIFLAK